MGPLKPIDILKTSSDLQSRVIRVLSKESELDKILTEVVERATQVLDASACAIFTLDRPQGRSATQRAGSGYKKPFDGRRDIEVVPPGQVPMRPEPGKELGLTGWVLSTGLPFLASSPEELKGHPHHSGRFDHLQSPQGELLLESFLGVPIHGLRGEVIGMIKAERRLNMEGGPSTFDIHDGVALESIARVASRCMTYLDMAREGCEDEAIRGWARDVIADATGTEGEVDSFLDIVVKVTAAAMRADACGIFLEDELGRTLTQRAGFGHLAQQQGIRSYRLPEPSVLDHCRITDRCHPPDCTWAGEGGGTPDDPEKRAGLTAWIQITGKSFHASSYEELVRHCHHSGEFDRQNFPEKGTKCGAFLGVPLKVGETVIGVLKVENESLEGVPDTRDFSTEAQRRFEILAQDIALAIVRLEAQLETRYGIIRKAEEKILKILRGGRDIKDLVSQVVEETRELFQAGACALFLKEGNLLRQPRWAASGWFQKGPEVREYTLVPRDSIKEDPTEEEKVGLTTWIAVTQKKFTARSCEELRMHPHHRGTFDEHNFEKGSNLERCESFMGFPLLVEKDGRKQLVGVLKVESKMRFVDGVKEYTYFNELDEVVFELIANSAALAIQNTYLARESDTARERAWREFSSGTAHRIGTQSANIRNALGWVRKALKGSESADIDEGLARAVGALGRVDGFVREFTAFVAPPEARTEPVDVNQLCRKVHSDAKGVGPIQPALELDPHVPTVWGDRGRLLYALEEMFQNALKAVKDRGTDGKVTIKTRSGDKANIVIEFIDNGTGVDPDQKTTIFKPGVRFRPGGIGLGLAIVRETIDQHRGSIKEIGTARQGAHFVIELPIGASDRPPERILIVEDDPDLCSDVVRLLGSGAPNRKLAVASNERDAIALIGKGGIDLVITDIDLSDGGGTRTGGLELLKTLQSQHPELPVIVVTINDRVEDEAKRLGCRQFIRRPYPGRDYLDVLGEAVADALESDRSLTRYTS
jgi:signal transduction histidine kinase/CheY-like chemotaxis protein